MLNLLKKDMLKKWYSVLLTALEIAIIMYMAVIIISTYEFQSIKYQPYAELLDSKGVRAYTYEQLGGTKSGNEGLSNLVEKLNKVKGVTYSLITSTNLNGTSNMHFWVYGYGDMMADYNPDMKEGVWFTEYEGGEYPGVVVTENKYGIKTGDYIDIFDDETGESFVFFRAYVCGVIRNGESFYDGSRYVSPASIFDYYSTFNAETNAVDLDNPVILMSREDLEAQNMGLVDFGVFIEYEDNITEAEREENEKILTDIGMINDFEELKSNSIDVIMEKLMVIIPIAIGALFFVTLSIICNSAIDTNRALKHYSVYYLCGMPWSSIILMRLWNGLVTGVLSGGIMYLISKLMTKVSFGEDIVFTMGKYQWISCSAIIAYMIIVSLIIPMIIIRKNSPVKVLKKAEV